MADVLTRMRIKRNSSVAYAINMAREYLDNSKNPLGAANSILIDHGVKPHLNSKVAYIYALTVIESLVKGEEIAPASVVERSETRINNITRKMGAGAFKEEVVASIDEPSTKKGGKRAVAREIYFKYRVDKKEKEIIDIIAQELQVSKPNAYSYVYLIKKEMKNDNS